MKYTFLGETMTRTELKTITARLSPTMRGALVKLATQARDGRGNDLSTTGITRSTLRALRDRGFIRFTGVRMVEERNYRSGRMHRQTVFTTRWAL
jgi:hypothetical protein